MTKYIEDKWYVEKYGIETCKQMDAYYEDYSNRLEIGKQKMLENIDSLFNQIKEKSGLTDLAFNAYWKETRGDFYLEIESSNFADKFPVIFNAWKEMKVCNFGGNFWARRNKSGYYGGEEDFTKLCPNIGYGLSVDYCYESQDGGSNGTAIGHAWTDEEHNWEWQYETVIERKEK